MRTRLARPHHLHHDQAVTTRNPAASSVPSRTSTLPQFDSSPAISRQEVSAHGFPLEPPAHHLGHDVRPGSTHSAGSEYLPSTSPRQATAAVGPDRSSCHCCRPTRRPEPDAESVRLLALSTRGSRRAPAKPIAYIPGCDQDRRCGGGGCRRGCLHFDGVFGPGPEGPAEHHHRFAQAVSTGDGDRACSLLSAPVADALTQSAGMPCDRAVLQEHLPHRLRSAR